MEEIILKELANEPLTSDERLQLNRWLNKSVSNRRLYHQIRLSIIGPLEDERQKLKKETWEEIVLRLEHSQDVNKTRRWYLPIWVKVAAVFIISFGFMLLLYEMSAWQKSDRQAVNVKLIEKMSMPGQKVTISLSDGTVVKLNSDSRLVVPETFSGTTREVTLYGEAFFDVVRDESKPFVIKTKDVNVRVLGTSFNVKAYPEDNESTVAVATGKVSVSDGKEQQALVPGERISYREMKGLSAIEKFEQKKEFEWKDNILLFEAKSLEEVLKVLSRWYGVEFEILSPRIDVQKKFSGRYNNPSLKRVLQGLSYVYTMDYEIDDNNKKVILR
jgi:transmembrane sensor